MADGHGFFDDEKAGLKGRRQKTGAGKSFAILRVGKIKSRATLSAALGHNLRELETPNADASLSKDNTVLRGGKTVADGLAAWDERAPDKIRKNAVHAVEYFVGGSPEKLKEMPFHDQAQYFSEALRWIEERHGAKNVLSSVVHLDETTPHMQVIVIPLDERGKLNAREFIGGSEKLREMQTDFAERVGAQVGLERGMERSKATHQSIREYYGRVNSFQSSEISLPERGKGLGLGIGAESSEKWLQRASEAATEQLITQTAILTEKVSDLEQALEISTAAQKRAEKMLSDERSTSKEFTAFIASTLQVEDKSSYLSRADTRGYAKAYNALTDRLTPEQDKLAEDRLMAVRVEVVKADGGNFAMSIDDCDALCDDLLSLKTTTRDAYRSLQNKLEVREEFEQRRRDRGKDQDLGWG